MEKSLLVLTSIKLALMLLDPSIPREDSKCTFVESSGYIKDEKHNKLLSPTNLRIVGKVSYALMAGAPNGTFR